MKYVYFSDGNALVDINHSTNYSNDTIDHNYPTVLANYNSLYVSVLQILVIKVILKQPNIKLIFLVNKIVLKKKEIIYKV